MSKLIGFTGNMGCGKSTAIEVLRNTGFSNTNVKFAQPLYDIQEYVYDRIDSVYKLPPNFVKDRKLLQWIGTEWGRDTISQTLWIDLWAKEVDLLQQLDWDVITCDDVRFDNEGEIFKKLGGIIIKINSTRADERINTNNGIAGHKSEIGLNEKYIDYQVDNNGTIKEFKASLNKIYDEILYGNNADRSWAI